MEKNEDAGKYEDENKGNKNKSEDEGNEEEEEEEEEGTKDDKEEAVGTTKTINIHEGFLGYIQTSPNAKWVNARRHETVELEDCVERGSTEAKRCRDRAPAARSSQIIPRERETEDARTRYVREHGVTGVEA